MKKIIILLLAVIMFGCSCSKSEASNTKGYIDLDIDSHIGISSLEVNEFKYKGHAYIICKIQGSRTSGLSHAGHCKCLTPQ